MVQKTAGHKAFSHGYLEPGFVDINRTAISEILDQENPVFLPPRTDYLVLGICMNDDLYEKFLTKINGMDWHLSTRLYISRGTIYCDGAPAGRVAGSRAPSTTWGKKCVFHFTGSWFRHPARRDGEKGGSGLGESEALDFIEQLAKHFALRVDGFNGDWVNFRTIDRWDVVMELNLKDGHRKSAWAPDVVRKMEALTLPFGQRFGDFRDSETGQTLYASTSSNPTKTRGDLPLTCIYQEAGTPDRLRVEVRVPKVRNVNERKSFGQNHAAEYVAKVLNAYSPVPVRAAAECGQQSIFDGSLESPRLDFKKVKPEEYRRRPYGGHPSKTLRRLARQGMTILRRSTTAFITASLLSSPAMAGDALNKDLDVGRGYHRLPDVDAPVQSEVHGDIRPDEARPFDHGFAIDDICDHRPLNLDELEELQIALELYRRRFLPDTKPFWVNRWGELQQAVVPPDPRVTEDESEWVVVEESQLDGKTQQVVRRVVEAEEEWIQRYLDPTTHEPLNTSERWLITADEDLLTFWPPESEKPLAAIPREKRF